MANIPTVEFNEVVPNGFESRALGGSRLRELKIQFREILAADHVVSSSGSGGDWGYHNKLSFTDYSSAVGVANAFVLYSKTVSGKTELHFVDEDDNDMQITSGGLFSGGMIGEIRMFKGLLTAIPDGWELCDGTGSTPNLVAKFIRGVATDATDPGTTGGSDSMADVIDHTHAITIDNSTGHTHTGSTDAGGNFIGVGSLASGSSPSGLSIAEYTHSHAFTTASGGDHDHTGVTSTENTASIDNRPAYYECAYIIKT